MTNTQFPSDSLTITLEETIKEFSNTLANIANNTDSFNSWFTGTFTILSFVASLVTIGGIIALFADYMKKRMSTRKQISIILDLMRHFMENNAILEVILEEKKKNKYPIEGTLSRFATLEDDTDIGRLSVSADQYERLHNLSLSIRNYNSIVYNLDKHITNPSYPDQLLTQELHDVKNRSNKICDALFEVSEKLHGKKRVTSARFAEYIKDRYSEDMHNIEAEIKEGKITKYNIVNKINGDYYSKLGLIHHYEIRITKQARKNLILYKRAQDHLQISSNDNSQI